MMGNETVSKVFQVSQRHVFAVSGLHKSELLQVFADELIYHIKRLGIVMHFFGLAEQQKVLLLTCLVLDFDVFL